MIRITKAAANDIADIKKIEIECGLSSWTENDYLMETERTDSLFYTAKVDEEIVGFILARLITNNDNSHLSTFTHSEIEIYNIGVKTKFMGKSIGSNLLQKVFNVGENKQIKSFYLEVRESNNKALAFYKKHSFKIIGERKKFYQNPEENALLMSRTNVNR